MIGRLTVALRCADSLEGATKRLAGKAPREVGAARRLSVRGEARTARRRCFAAADCWKWGEKRDFIARTASVGEPFLVASLARGDNERLKSESLVALSEEKQKQILHSVQDDTPAREEPDPGENRRLAGTAPRAVGAARSGFLSGLEAPTP